MKANLINRLSGIILTIVGIIVLITAWIELFSESLNQNNVSRKLAKNWNNSLFTLSKSKLNNLNYFNLSIIANNSICEKENQRICGVIDDLGNLLCLEKDIECPVNNIIKINKTGKFTDNNFIISNNDTNNTIASQFVFAEGQPCYDFRYEYKNCPFYDINNTNNDKVQKDARKLDYNYKPIDIVPAIEEFDSDSKLIQMIKHSNYDIQSFPIGQTLYYRGYYGLNITCYNYLKQNNIDIIDKFGKFNLGFNIYYFLTGFILGFTITFLGILLIDNKEENIRLRISITETILLIISIVFFIYISSYYDIDDLYIAYILDNDCLKTQFTENLRNIVSPAGLLSTLTKIGIYSYSFALILILANLLSVFYRFKFKNKYEIF